MIDEARLEDAFAELAATIAVPADGLDRVLEQLDNTTSAGPENRSRFMKPLLAVAAAIAVVAVVVAAVHGSSGSESAHVASAPTALTPLTTAGAAPRGQKSLFGTPPGIGGGSASAGGSTAVPGAANGSGSGGAGPAATGPVDAAKIVKTGTLDLQVPHATLRLSVSRVTAATIGLGGYVAESKTNYGDTDPSAEITIRVPVDQFDTAITRLDALPGVKVLGDSENGVDVTSQFHDLQAQLKAATGTRDALYAVLARANNIGDILAVTDRLNAAQTVVDQLQARVNTLSGQATFSSLAVTLSEKPVPAAKAAVHTPKPATGLAKSWSDARRGFADAVEWLIAGSGTALIVLLAALALLFGIRYLYPVVRRGLV